MSHDQNRSKCDDVTTPTEKFPMDFYQGVVFAAQICDSNHSVNRDEENCQSHMIKR